MDCNCQCPVAGFCGRCMAGLVAGTSGVTPPKREVLYYYPILRKKRKEQGLVACSSCCPAQHGGFLSIGQFLRVWPEAGEVPVFLSAVNTIRVLTFFFFFFALIFVSLGFHVNFLFLQKSEPYFLMSCVLKSEPYLHYSKTKNVVEYVIKGF